MTPEVVGALARANARFRPHGGSIELVDLRDGEASIRFAGLCTGCPCRPQCLVATVEPELLAVPAVTSVRAAGVRLDDDARERLAAFLATPYREGP